MSQPIPLYPDRHEPVAQPEPTPDANVPTVPQETQEERDQLTLSERIYLARQARLQRAQEERASRGQTMTPLAESLQPWLARRGMPARCPQCGYSGVVREEPSLTEDGRLVYTRIYCTCAWAEKARNREQDARKKMVTDLKAQHEARLRRNLVLPAAYKNYTLDSHPLTRYNPALHADIVDWLRLWNWRRGLILRGPYGRGKTAYLVAMLQALLPRAVDEGWGMLYTGGAELFNRLQDGLDDDTYARTRDEFSRVHLLAVDDLGAAQQVTKWRQDQYLSIFEARYANDLPLFITTNLNDDELRTHLTERVYWRLVERCDLIDVDGPNLRDARDVKRWQSKGRK